MSERTKETLAHVLIAAAVAFTCSLCYVLGQWAGYSDGYTDGSIDGSAQSLPPVVIRLDDGTMSVGVKP